jgi:hypothetical protein
MSEHKDKGKKEYRIIIKNSIPDDIAQHIGSKIRSLILNEVANMTFNGKKVSVQSVENLRTESFPSHIEGFEIIFQNGVPVDPTVPS